MSVILWGPAWQERHAWQGVCMVGACMAVGAYVAGGREWKGCAWQGGMHGIGYMAGRVYVAGVCAWLGGCVTGETATAADITHPTGMHSHF